MADFTPTIISSSVVFTEPKKQYFFVHVQPNPFIIRSGEQITVNTYIQRIYDSVLSQYVYYSLSYKTSSPPSGQTTPNHTGQSNLVLSTHEVLAMKTEII